MINPKRKIHSYNNPNKYWDETKNMSTILRLRGGNALVGIKSGRRHTTHKKWWANIIKSYTLFNKFANAFQTSWNLCFFNIVTILVYC